MPDITTSNPVDTFMQSADEAAMRAAMGAAESGTPPASLDSLEKIAASIGNNPALMATLAAQLAGKVDTAAIVNDLTTGGTAVPLSAEQGKTLKGLVDTEGGFRGAKVTNTSGTTQTIPSSTFTKLQACLDSEVYDTDGWMDATAKFLPDVAGYYQVEGIWIGTPSSNGFFITALYKNGALHSILGRGVVSASVICGFSGTDTVHLNGTTDYLELYAFHIAGSVTTYTSANYNRFSCRLLGT